MKKKAVHICPSLLRKCKGETGYSEKASRLLFDGKIVSEKLPYTRLEDNETIDTFIDNSKRISVPGVQIKYSVIVDNGILRVTKPEEQGTFILKPIPNHLRNRSFCPANEHLTMQIASQVYGIPTPSNGLCFFKDGSPAYFVRRFDIRAAEKLLKEDFASLGGLTNKNGGSDYKYDNLSYEDCAKLIEKYSSVPRVDKLRFFEVLLFNFVFCNGDAHLKNFSLLEEKEGKFRLSPAYDLLNTRLHVDDPIFALHKGLFTAPKPEYFGIQSAIIGKTFQVFGERIGLPDSVVSSSLNKFIDKHELTDVLIKNSFLSESLQKEYRSMHNARINSFLSVV